MKNNRLDRERMPDSIVSDFVCCTGIAGTRRRATESLLRLLREAGAEFYFVEPDGPVATPEAEIEPNGELSCVGIVHPELCPGALATEVKPPWLGDRGDAGITVLPGSQELMIDQDTFIRDTKKTDDLVSAHRHFMFQLLPMLKPKFAWLDAAGDSAPGSKFVQRVELKRAFWTMFFGPPFVEKFGRDFLLAAPAWRVEDLGDDGVMLTASEHYTDWLARPNEALLEYLSAKAPGIKPYRYKPIP